MTLVTCGAWGWRRRFFRGEEPSSARVKVNCWYSSRRRCSSAGSSERRFCRFFHGIQRKNVVFRGCPRLLAEEPAEPSSAGYLSFSRKNLRSLLPRTMFCCILVFFFFFENYVWTTNLLILLVSFFIYLLLQSVYVGLVRTLRDFLHGHFWTVMNGLQASLFGLDSTL